MLFFFVHIFNLTVSFNLIEKKNNNFEIGKMPNKYLLCHFRFIDLITFSVIVSIARLTKMPELPFFQIILNVVLNLFGVLFAIAAIVLYSIDLAIADLDWLCYEDYYGDGHRDPYYTKCLAAKAQLLVSLVPEIIA